MDRKNLLFLAAGFVLGMWGHWMERLVTYSVIGVLSILAFSGITWRVEIPLWTIPLFVLLVVVTLSIFAARKAAKC